MSNKTLNYKGYCGSSEFSFDDDCLFGKIMFITDLITYEAQTVPELKKSFEEAVDFYIEKCQQEGLSADKPFSGTFNVRTGQDLHRKAAQVAYSENMNLNEFVTKAIERAVDHSRATKVEHTHNHNHIVTIQDNVISGTRVATMDAPPAWETLYATAH